MFFKFTTIAVNCYLVSMLSVISIVGDYYVFRSNKSNITRALVDNVTHTLVGAISWMVVVINHKDISASISSSIQQVMLCAIIASFIDLDHFITARSFNLKEATSLSIRPPLHCTTLPLVLTVLMLLLSHVQKYDKLKIAAFILFIAFISHHTRDATRRGYWLYPFGSTPPVPYALYILITCLLPYLVCLFHKNSSFFTSSRSGVSQSVSVA